MNMKEKGFSLLELIATIVILSLIISISTMVYLGIKQNILNKDYDNLVMYLETKAAEYATETNITTISVEGLIQAGVVSPDDQSDIFNPKTNESMNCYIIKSTKKDGEYVAKLGKNLGTNEEGVCNTYTVTNKLEICKYDELTNKCEVITSDSWYNEDIKLSVKYSGSNEEINKDNTEFNWTSTNGFSSEDNIVSTNTSLISQSYYTCSINIDDTIGKASAKINIDKQKPSVFNVNFASNWQTEKEVIIEASDMGGSGIKGYALVDASEECTSYNSSNKFKVNKNGKYKYCVMDNVGNITSDIIEISKIDTCVIEKPVITSSDNLSQDKWHRNEFNLNFSLKNNNCESNITYYYGTSSNNLSLHGDSTLINSGYSRKTLYVKACNEAGTCSKLNSYTILYDNTPPTYSSGGSIGAGTISKPTYMDNTGGSGDITVYTCVTTGSVPSNSDSCFSASNTTYNYSCGVTYKLYSYAVDAVGNKSDVYDHATNNNATYFSSCGSKKKNHSSSCDNTCKMQKNSEAWHNTTSQSEKDRLHQANVDLAKNNSDCKGSCSYNSSSGTWSNSGGSSLYNVSGGNKK